MGLPSGTGPRFLLAPSQNMYRRGEAVALKRDNTITSVSIMPLVHLMVSIVESPSGPQYPLS